MNLSELQALVPSTKLYPRSLVRAGGETLCFAQDAHQHYLLIAHDPLLPSFARDTFSGEVQDFEPHLALKWCLPSSGNARKLRSMFPFCAPKPLGVQQSIGFADRMGLAGAAHLRAARECGLGAALVLAQQSLAAMKLAIRRPDEVLDAASWAVFQENHRAAWGADADNLRTPDEARTMARAGFKGFTLDLSQQFNADADTDHPTRFAHTIAHVEAMTAVLEEETRGDYDLEISLAYAAYPTTRDDHAFLARALLERGIRMTAFAPRSPWAPDDPSNSEESVRQHVEVARELGPYLVSMDCDTNNVDTLGIIGRECGEMLHFKAQDEAFVQAWRVVSQLQPALFDEMLRAVKGGDGSMSPENERLRRASSSALILGGKDERGAWLFRTKLYRLLLDNEPLHHDLLVASDQKHFAALGWCRLKDDST